MSDQPQNAFPIRPQPDDDPRFTVGLALDVKKLLIEHGYSSDWTGRDLFDLQQALFRFLYSEDNR